MKDYIKQTDLIPLNFQVTALQKLNKTLQHLKVRIFLFSLFQILLLRNRERRNLINSKILWVVNETPSEKPNKGKRHTPLKGLTSVKCDLENFTGLGDLTMGAESIFRLPPLLEVQEERDQWGLAAHLKSFQHSIPLTKEEKGN